MITLSEAHFITAVLSGTIFSHDKHAPMYTPAQFHERQKIAERFLTDANLKADERGERQARAEWLFKHLGGTL